MIYFVTKVEIKNLSISSHMRMTVSGSFALGDKICPLVHKYLKFVFFSYELIYNEFGSQLSQQSTSMDEQLMCQVSDIFETPKNVFWMNFKISNL